MERSIVAVVRCDSYDLPLVHDALRRGIELLGGLDRYVRPGEQILLKPNILAGEGPERAVTTHPAVLEACVGLFRSAGATVRFGDSPGLEDALHAAQRSGLHTAGIRSGATFEPFSSGARMDNPEGDLVDSFPIAQAVHDCDGLINLPKMKTHQLTRITGAVKNVFGCIPGKRKALYHVQFQDVMVFSAFLAELGRRVRPRLHVMDGIVAMEGHGPRGGDPRPTKVLILSEDPVAVDATFCRLVALDPTYVPTIVAGHGAGLGHFRVADIEYVGDDPASLVDPGFRLVRRPVYRNASYAHYPLIKNALLPRPAIDAARCVRCGICVEACPVPGKALRFQNGRRVPPTYDHPRCIRCYCCQEMCPHQAIETRTPLLGRILKLGALSGRTAI
jgi:uncharacterized protein (DUF362 family)/NAD-dependent dihydropyrimidine dehydrogenase PreA subunit